MLLDERNLGFKLSVCKYFCPLSLYMFICSELIEETGRPPGLIFDM